MLTNWRSNCFILFLTTRSKLIDKQTESPSLREKAFKIYRSTHEPNGKRERETDWCCQQREEEICYDFPTLLRKGHLLAQGSPHSNTIVTMHHTSQHITFHHITSPNNQLHGKKREREMEWRQRSCTNLEMQIFVKKRGTTKKMSRQRDVWNKSMVSGTAAHERSSLPTHVA